MSGLYDDDDDDDVYDPLIFENGKKELRTLIVTLSRTFYCHDRAVFCHVDGKYRNNNNNSNYFYDYYYREMDWEWIEDKIFGS